MLFFGQRIRSRRLREERKRRFQVVTTLSVGLVLALLVLFSQASRVSHLLIEDIQIEGNESITDKELISFVKGHFDGTFYLLYPRNNLLLISNSKIESSIKREFYRIDKVDFGRLKNNLLVVTVSERDPVGVWCRSQDGGGCYFLDEGGFIFAPSPNFSGDVFYRYVGGKVGDKAQGSQFLSSDDFSKMNWFIERLANLGVDTDLYKIVDESTHEVYMKYGGKIIFQATKPYEVILENIRAILASDVFKQNTEEVLRGVDYIDLRFGNKVFYKLFEDES